MKYLHDRKVTGFHRTNTNVLLHCLLRLCTLIQNLFMLSAYKLCEQCSICLLKVHGYVCLQCICMACARVQLWIGHRMSVHLIPALVDFASLF